MSCYVFSTTGLGADVILRQNATGGQDQRVFAIGALRSRHVFGQQEAVFVMHELVGVHDRCVVWVFFVARLLDVTLYFGQLVAQFELSVVITLVLECGKWKVV